MRLLIHFTILKEAGGGHAVLFAVLLVVPAESLCGAYSVFRNYSLTCFEPPPQPSPTLAVVLTVNLLFYLLAYVKSITTIAELENRSLSIKPTAPNAPLHLKPLGTTRNPC